MMDRYIDFLAINSRGWTTDSRAQRNDDSVETPFPFKYPDGSVIKLPIERGTLSEIRRRPFVLHMRLSRTSLDEYLYTYTVHTPDRSVIYYIFFYINLVVDYFFLIIYQVYRIFYNIILFPRRQY